MATKSEKSDLSELLAKAEEDFKVSQNGVTTIKTLKQFKSVAKNQRFKTLLDSSVKLISEEQQTIKVILTIAKLYYSQSDDKTSVRWFLKYLTKLKLETSISKSEKIEKCLTAEYMLGCCYFNLNNYKMAYKCLKTSPPDPTNVSTYLKHCDMLIHSCRALELHDEMLIYLGLSDKNPSEIFNANIRIENAKCLNQFCKIAGAIQHLKEASYILNNCQGFQGCWLHIADIYTNLKMHQEAYKCNQNYVDSLKDQSLDFLSKTCLLKVLLNMAEDNWHILNQHRRAISNCQHVLELLRDDSDGNLDRLTALYTMAECYYSLNDFEPAIRYFEELLEAMKKAHNISTDHLDYCHLSKVWLRISTSQLLSGSYRTALKSAKKSEKYLRKVPGKFPGECIETLVQLSYCWKKMEHPQKAIMFMTSAIDGTLQLNSEDNWKQYQYTTDIKTVYIGACEHQLSGNFAKTDSIFKSILLQEASNGLQQVMQKIHFCVKYVRKVFPEDGQLFWSRINYICCNDAKFVSQLPNGFKKRFFQYKNSLEGCNHLVKTVN
jgi:tetratricopeptide (TPR) repeat protein